jgi:hypothetical protein
VVAAVIAPIQIVGYHHCGYVLQWYLMRCVALGAFGNALGIIVRNIPMWSCDFAVGCLKIGGNHGDIFEGSMAI